MALKIAVQMDHIANISIGGDTSFALCLEAQARGHELYHYTPDRLTMSGTDVTAAMEPLTVRDVEGDHYTFGERKRTSLRDVDVVLLRQDPPFDMNYITTTHMLELVHPDTLVVNNPRSVRNAPEKIFVMEYADLMPETIVTLDLDEIRAFREKHGDIILKPLYGNGGAGVFHLRDGDRNLTSLMEMFSQLTREPIIAQRYLSDVREGDKRILLIDGKPVGAINRVPDESDTRSNMHVGGQAIETTMTERELEICARIGPELNKRGLTLVGIDVIGGLMTEINVTSPTGIQELERFDGINVAEKIWQAIEARR